MRSSTPHPALTRTRTRTRPVRRRAAALAAAPLLAAGLASPASAHDQLVRADPSDGQTVTTAPSELTLEFSGELINGGEITNMATVRDADGNEWQRTTQAQVQGRVMTAPLCDGLPNGTYEAAYRVVYSDGHTETMSHEFTVDDPQAPEEGTAPSGDCGTPADQAVQIDDGPAERMDPEVGAPDDASGSDAAQGSAGGATQDGADGSEPADGAGEPQRDASQDPSSAAADGQQSSDQAGLPAWVWISGVGGLVVIVAAAVLTALKARSLGRS